MPRPLRSPVPALRAAALALALAAGCSAGRAQSPAAAPAEPASLPLADVNGPGDGPPVSRRIAELQKAGQRAQALALAEEHLAAHPRDTKVMFARAILLADLGRTDDAIAAFERITQEFPELPESYNNIAVLRAARGELSQAEHFLLLAVAARPDYATAQENLGDLYLSLASAAYERASSLRPEVRALRTKLSLAREFTERVRSAR